MFKKWTTLIVAGLFSASLGLAGCEPEDEPLDDEPFDDDVQQTLE